MADGRTPRRAGMREVARAAGVSSSTVANVLNNPGLVAATTRQRVVDAMHLVGFVRSGPARQLRGAPSRLVGAVVLDQGNAFYAAVGRGIEDRITEAGCMLLTCSTDMQADKEARTLRVLEEQAVRGIIITPTEQNPDQLASVAERGTPVILLDCPRDRLDLCAVTVDHVLGGRLVGEHLTALGHRRVAFLLGTADISPVTERRKGVVLALVAAGLDPGDALIEIRVPSPTSFDDAEAAVGAILADPDPPTAIVCVNDVTALGVIRGLALHGLRAPDDMSVVGYDDMQFAAHLHPRLTTVARPTRQLGWTAADLLLDESSADHEHRELQFRPALVVRDSTAAPAHRR